MLEKHRKPKGNETSKGCGHQYRAGCVVDGAIEEQSVSPQADKSGQNPAKPAGRAGQADTPLADKPVGQAERPARQASPSTATQADRASTATGGANSRTFTGTIVNATCSQASSLMRSGSFADQSVSS